MQEFPKWKYHAEKPPVIVSGMKEEEALGKDWQDRPVKAKNGSPTASSSVSPSGSPSRAPRKGKA